MLSPYTILLIFKSFVVSRQLTPKPCTTMPLPNELLFAIINHLDRETLKSFRLVSCGFRTLAIKRLFEKVNLSPFTESFH
jgi:hypothetical protein